MYYFSDRFVKVHIRIIFVEQDENLIFVAGGSDTLSVLAHLKMLAVNWTNPFTSVMLK